MRLWTLHPKYLDAKGLVALWREALLAQAVLRRRTRGYTRHPQLLRFRRARRPVGSIATYLQAVCAEAQERGYHFAPERIARAMAAGQCVVTRGQLEYEWAHLLAKLRGRDPRRFAALRSVRRPEPHPMFEVVRGGIEGWERARNPARGRR